MPHVFRFGCSQPSPPHSLAPFAQASAMSQKRRPEDGKAKPESSSPEDKRRKVPALTSVVHEAMRLHSFRNLLEPILEPLLRRVVKEEVESALRRHLISMKQACEKEILTSESRNLQLRFESNISPPIFTGARIEGEDGSNLRISLVDVLTGQVVSSGPESAAKVEIVVLEGDFEDRSDIWTPEEFRSNIVKERDGKKPLLTGDVFLYLKDGIGVVGEVSFTDNSSWTRSRKFRLGARAVNNFDGFSIKEAKTDSFIVRDHRGELYKKHHPPSLSDEVWRLEKIGKDGAFHKRLSQEKIDTVKDFLTQLNLDSAKLRSILGTGMSTKMWEATVEHAQTCVLDTRRFLYFPSHSQPKSGVVFNAVGQVTGLLSESQFVPVDKLSETEKADAQSSVLYAIQQREKFDSFNDGASLMEDNLLFPSCSPNSDGYSASKILSPQKTDRFDYFQGSAPSPDILSSVYSVGASDLDEYCLPISDGMNFRYDQTLGFPVQTSNSFIGETDTVSHVFDDHAHLHFLDADIQSPIHKPDKSAVDGKAQKRWRMLFNVVKWLLLRKKKT
ncbi:calmodulin-binding protein 60 A-like isoform X2 [Prosopis cineraria]|uniref:calmodulin-binding protein 60 A-like isoform X2 n=1 Tax=Prosopis cineraria TaxID=364024 RepID=UPI0024109E38|nr:calmodulin-binding protein 60 A-like isoform X2 [Prosopis cineraria]